MDHPRNLKELKTKIASSLSDYEDLLEVLEQEHYYIIRPKTWINRASEQKISLILAPMQSSVLINYTGWARQWEIPKEDINARIKNTRNKPY